MPKSEKVQMIERTTAVSRTGITSGSVMCRKRWSLLAPSMVEAS